MSLKLGNLICAHADFENFIYNIMGISSQEKNIYVYKNTYMSSKIRIS